MSANYIWHPCSQMKDYETFPPLNIRSAHGSYIKLANGRTIIDAVSSWWCKSLGHNHPRLKQALQQQIKKFTHVLLANTTYEAIEELAVELAKLLPSLNKIFFASEGSSSIEIALKMSLHWRQILGQNQRKYFIALENSYHGETIGALSVSDVAMYKKPYASLLFKTYFLSDLPYVNSTANSLWQDSDVHWQQIEKVLTDYKNSATAVIVEPILQAAGGMKIYSQDFLHRLRKWCTTHNIHLIADEIMTGIGRTGKMLACDHAQIIPDFLCLAKGLTSGWLPLSVVMTNNEIYQAFYADYSTNKAFLHSHTYSGNALGVRVALEVLKIIREEKILDHVQVLNAAMNKAMLKIAKRTGRLKNVRNIGAMVAADLDCDPKRRVGFAVFQKAAQLGALLRPLGNTIYWVPPLNCQLSTLQELAEITEAAILAVEI